MKPSLKKFEKEQLSPKKKNLFSRRGLDASFLADVPSELRRSFCIVGRDKTFWGFVKIVGGGGDFETR